MKYSMGIDIGASGAIAIMNEDRGLIMTAKVTHDKGETDIEHIIELCEKYQPKITIEQPNRGRSKKGDRRAGIPSTFQHLGQIQGALKARGISYEMIAPVSWQKYIRPQVLHWKTDEVRGWYTERGKTPPKQSKINSIAFCWQNRYTVPLTSKSSRANIDDGIADAICIAWVAI